MTKFCFVLALNTFVILQQNFDWFSCQQKYHKKKDHYMPEFFKDIPWCKNSIKE